MKRVRRRKGHRTKMRDDITGRQQRKGTILEKIRRAHRCQSYDANFHKHWLL